MKKPPSSSTGPGESPASLYRAPALEKGLDILELFAREPNALSVTEIVQKLGRSTGELFRMIQVLEHRGFLEEDENGSYRLTNKLFTLGMHQPAVRSAIDVALPYMRQLSMDIGQSCHLAFHSDGHIVVVARMESSERIGFSVRIGYRKPLIHTASGAVLYAFQPELIRGRWESLLRSIASKEDLTAFRNRADRVRKRGYEIQPSDFVQAVTDISAPVLRDDVAAAALTVPFLQTATPLMPLQETREQVVQAARAISNELVVSDQRV